MSEKTALVLFNLGGPDSLSAVQPFLKNLFSDPAIIGAPSPIRWLLARLISSRRAPIAREIYTQMGGRSPILPNTEAQARALEAELGEGYKTFICMRYWHPRAADIVKQVEAYQPDRILLLPLYPQYSTTTSGSSIKEFLDEIKTAAPRLQAQLDAGLPVDKICCYPIEPGFIEAQADLIRPYLIEAAKFGTPRLLLSAHGLPEKIIAGGDPYQAQCEQTAKAIITQLNWPELDWKNTYQSRVGPLKWIGPSTEDEVEKAGHDKVPLVVVPIAFVSEHSETLVELDIEYRELALQHGVPHYGRAPTVAAHPAFIKGLANLVRGRISGDVTHEKAEHPCSARWTKCPCRIKAETV